MEEYDWIIILQYAETVDFDCCCKPRHGIDTSALLRTDTVNCLNYVGEVNHLERFFFHQKTTGYQFDQQPK